MDELKSHLIPHKDLLKLMLAGNSTLIFLNPKTGGRRQYHITLNKAGDKHHVKLVVAPGTEVQFEKYLGTIGKDNQFWTSKAILLEESSFMRLWHSILSGRLNPEMQVMHTGRCCACNRMLTDPLSIELGIGPFCRGEK